LVLEYCSYLSLQGESNPLVHQVEEPRNLSIISNTFIYLPRATALWLVKEFYIVGTICIICIDIYNKKNIEGFIIFYNATDVKQPFFISFECVGYYHYNSWLYWNWKHIFLINHFDPWVYLLLVILIIKYVFLINQMLKTSWKYTDLI